ncbi:hotdog fold thioesterase [Arthrobacter sp. ATA002]|uniref:hotdog fold thioesterase n=1 Tax=Arthrobacter sp. ATA002 TaxID=2991715 RepID=UPI0022A781FA|nr:hotdog fold thioesterase [Arthrobacter sp. ATA002]WAP52420.1 hotdog fold thioesterase [Arthrobacter sp. ATA002]
MADIDVTAVQGAMLHPILEDDAVARWLGLVVEHLAPGKATISMELRADMLNGFSIAHGGMIFAFADTAFALACNPANAASLADMDLITVASGADINFISTALPGETLRAVAAHRTSAGRSGLYDIEITASGTEDGSRVVAEFRGRSRSIPNPRHHSRT